MQCTRRSAAFMNVFGATACAIDAEIRPRNAEEAHLRRSIAA